MRYILIGNGRPAMRALQTLTKAGETDIICYTDETEKEVFRRTATKAGLKIRGEADIRALSGGQGDVADWLLCFNSTTIIPAGVLQRISKGAVNFHPGKLPDYAGLNTHQWAIRNGETTAGVTLHFMEAGVDTGDIIAEDTLEITRDDTGFSLFNKCIKSGCDMIIAVVGDIINGVALPRKTQDLSQRRLYRRADALDGAIDWTWSAETIVNFARAGDYHPYPTPNYSAQWTLPDGREVIVLTAKVMPDPPALTTGEARLVAGKVIVGCGNAEAVSIEKALFDGAIVEPDQWAAILAVG